MKDKEFKIPQIPNCVSGFRKDGKRDRRFKRGNTIAEVQNYLEDVSGGHKILKFNKHL